MLSKDDNHNYVYAANTKDIEADKVFCIIDATSKDSVEKNHDKLEIKCEWIMEVKTTA